MSDQQPAQPREQLPVNPKHRWLPTVALVSVTAAWGSTFPLIKDIIQTVPVSDFLFVRFLIAAAVLAALRPSSAFALAPGARRHGLILGLVYGAAQLLQTFGLERTSASVSGFVTGMYVVLTPVFAALILRQRIDRMTWLAVGLATVGLGVLSLQGFGIGVGEALTLLAAALYAVHILGLGAWSTAGDAYGLSVIQMAAIAAICGLGALPGGVTLPASANQWLILLYTAIVAGALALVVQTWSQAHLSATRAAIVMTLEPAFAAFFAVLIGGETLTIRVLFGGVLVLAAMYLAELGPRHSKDAELPHLAG